MSSKLLFVSQFAPLVPPLLEKLQFHGLGLQTVAPEQCRSAIAENSPDLIFFILTSPTSDASGFETVETCVTSLHKQVPQIPMLILSEGADSSHLSNLLAAGASCFFDISEQGEATAVDLIMLIERLVERITSESIELSKLHNRIDELSSDQKTGLSVQNRLLPDAPAELNGFKLDHRIFPSVIMSGDTVDYFKLDEHRVLFYLADVSGHGAGAAMVSVALTSMAKRLRADFEQLESAGSITTTADILYWFNDALLTWQFEQHVTMFLGILDAQSNSLEYSNAAHFPGAIFRKDNEYGFLEMGGLPLGICATEYKFQRLNWKESLQLVLFSDGVLEIMSQASINEKEATLLSLLQYKNVDIEQLLRRLGLGKDRNIPDDIAILTVERQQ